MAQIKRTEEEKPRFAVGIDLGTTNCAVSYVDLERLEAPGASAFPETFLIPQGTAPNVVEARKTLPSFFARVYDAPALEWDDLEKRRDFSLKGRGAANPKDGKFGVVGVLARDFGPAETDSFTSSAKSWLCHSSVDRTAAILPRANAETSANARGKDGENENVETTRKRWSPVEISSFYLAHIRAAWNAKYPDWPLEKQEIAITIPASFDETARTLTLEAAKLAGIPRAALVEEPQAAFYSWLARHENDWTEHVKPGQKILVCDVGGGTTDFALIYALKCEERPRNKSNSSVDRNAQETAVDSVKFYRVAVGDHLVLGGDNLDLALYQYLEAKILAKRPTPLTARERALLLKESREAKEYFLSAESDAKGVRRFVLPSVGAKLISGGVAVDIEREEVEKILLDGFFPRVEADCFPARRKRSGLREIALPYASDPAVTKYLAQFLQAHRLAGADLKRAGVLGEWDDADSLAVDVVLFNGGAFESPKLRSRVTETLTSWQAGRAPVVLQNEDLYLAVAHGAAYYCLALRGLGARIGASLARSYYVGVDLDPTSGTEGATSAPTARNAKPKAVCLLHAQCEPGDEIALDKTFALAVDRPVAFPVFVSSVRTTDAPGDLIEIDPNETRELAPIRTALKTRSKAKKDAQTIRAKLVARPTEIGTIELFLQEVLPEDAGTRARASRWTLQFDARGGTQSDWTPGNAEGEESGVVDESLVEAGKRALQCAFAADDELKALGLERIKPKELFPKVFEALGCSKNDAPITTLRRLAEAALDLSAGRKLSAAVEARWFNWLGFALRPGFGAATDDWRVEQAWKTIGGPTWKSPEVRAQYWIMLRRVASGLTPGRQLTIAEPLLANVRELRRLLVDGKGKGTELDLGAQEGAEIWRLLGALEMLPNDLKEELGDAIADVSMKKKVRPVRDALVWALGRIGARTLFHAPLDRVLPPQTAKRWALRLLDDYDRGEIAPNGTDFFALAQLTRIADEPSFNVDEGARAKVEAFLAKHNAEGSTLAALERHGKLVDDVTKQIFGETLPLGLRWEN